jgi:hypothetical protein
MLISHSSSPSTLRGDDDAESGMGQHYTFASTTTLQDQPSYMTNIYYNTIDPREAMRAGQPGESATTAAATTTPDKASTSQQKPDHGKNKDSDKKKDQKKHGNKKEGKSKSGK